MNKILFRFVQIWHFYCTMFRGLLSFQTRCIHVVYRYCACHHFVHTFAVLSYLTTHYSWMVKWFSLFTFSLCCICFWNNYSYYTCLRFLRS